MCYDFCNQALVKTIKCSQVSSDGHEVDNLISNNFIKKNNGFLCASFVKPPIEITLQFICGVELHCVRFCDRIGSQRSVGFELYSHINHLGVDDQFSPDDICLLGKAFVNNSEESVCFVNRSFTNRRSCGCVLPYQDASTVVRNVGHHHHKALTNIKGITIRIVRTERGTVPSLKKLEIWAQPSRSLCKTVLESVDKAVDSIKKYTNRTGQGFETVEEQSGVNVVNLPEAKDDVPSEFLDTITHEMMTLPVLLPSGNCIDQSTLDRHCNAEAAWGRLPNDPFTGIPFHENLKPVISSALKSRIDSFLLTHEHLAKNLGRPVGHSAENKLTRSNGVRSSVESPTVSVLISKITSKRPLQCKVKEEDKTVTASCSSKRSKKEDIAEDDSPKSSATSVHQDVLRESLNSSLKNVLSDLKCFTKRKPKIESDTFCKGCKVKRSEYQLPCCHIICKSCLVELLKQNVASCPECRKIFIRSDPVKIYF